MNVLVTLNSLILGGCQLNAVDLAIAAEPHDVRSVIVGFRSTLPDSGPSMLDAADERGVHLTILDTVAQTTSAPALARLADDHDIDIVHGYGGWDLRVPFQGPCRWGRRPLVQTVYEMYVPSQVYPHQPLIVGTGYLVDEQRARPGTVDLISPPVDLVADAPDHDATEFMNTFGLDPSRCRVVIVSRLDEAMKELGIRQTIEAMALVDREHVDLVIVGTGDAEARLHAVADRVNQELGRSAVTFCGSMHDPRGAYAAADIVIGMGSSAAPRLRSASRSSSAASRVGIGPSLGTRRRCCTGTASGVISPNPIRWSASRRRSARSSTIQRRAGSSASTAASSPRSTSGSMRWRSASSACTRGRWPVIAGGAGSSTFPSRCAPGSRG